MRLKGSHVILSLVLLVSGFLIAFSFQQTKNEPEVVQLSDQQWEKDYRYRQQLINMEAKNKELRNELDEKRQTIQELEGSLGNQKEMIGNYVERKKELQMITGQLPIEGRGVAVTLEDAAYIPSEENVNQYIVHESHIHEVINELLSAGAQAVAINGQRLFRDSYISCTGPVITVDGVQHPAPFVISAIGKTDVLYASLTLTNGVVDHLVKDNIEVGVEKFDTIEMNARIISERG